MSLHSSGEAKQLPQIPETGLIHALSIEDRERFRAIIASIAASEGLPQLWTSSLEFALDEMADAMVRDDWIAALHDRPKVLPSKLYPSSSSAELPDSSGIVEDHLVISTGSEGRSRAPSDISAAPDDKRNTDALIELNKLNSQSTPPPFPSSEQSSLKHLVITLRGPNLRLQEHNIKFIPSSTKAESAISFIPDSFALPFSTEDDSTGTILFGLNEFDTELSKIHSFSLIGGTFSVRAQTKTIHQVLSRILRVCVYTRISLILEQFFLSNLGYRLVFPEPPKPDLIGAPLTPTTTRSSLTHPSDATETASLSRKNPHKRSLSRGLWSFISRKKDRFLHQTDSLEDVKKRSKLSLDSLPRTASLDIPLLPSPIQPSRQSIESTRPSNGLPRHIASLLENDYTIHENPLKPADETNAESHPFRYIVNRLNREKSLLSTSPTVSFDVPSLLFGLREKEDSNSARRLRADEKIGLESILGWDSRDNKGQGMVGLMGFLRHQSITVLHSSNTLTSPSSLKSLPSSDVNLDSSVQSESRDEKSPCLKNDWHTFRYWSRNSDEDVRLGTFVTSLCRTAGERCQKNPSCHFTVGQHDWQWIHASVRVTANITPLESAVEDEGIKIWRICSQCGQSTFEEEMNAYGSLMSFGKFLELLIYSLRVQNSKSSVDCEHAKISHHNVKICFAHASNRVTFTTEEIEVIYDVVVPYHQVGRSDLLNKHRQFDGLPIGTATKGLSTLFQEPSVSDDVKALRKEIDEWYERFDHHLQQVSDLLTDEAMATPIHSRQPTVTLMASKISPVDDEVTNTPRARLVELPSIEMTHGEFDSSTDDSLTDTSSITTTASSESQIGSLELFQHLRSQLEKHKDSVYTNLAETPLIRLNDARRHFKSHAKSAAKRLEAWQAKHMSYFITFDVKEPDWWAKGYYAIPGSRYVVRETDWGSVIAATLGSQEYAVELTKMSTAGSRMTSLTLPNAAGLSAILSGDSEPTTASGTPNITPSTSTTSLTNSDNPPRYMRHKFIKNKPPQGSPNPDDFADHSQWDSPETYTTSLSRREHPRDISMSLNILSSALRSPETLRGRRSMDSSPSSKFGSISSAASRLVHLKSAPISSAPSPPPSAWAKPAVEINREAAGAGQAIEENWRKEATQAAERLLAQPHLGEIRFDRATSPRLLRSVFGSPTENKASPSTIKTSITRSDSGTLIRAVTTLESESPTVLALKGDPVKHIDSNASYGNSLSQAFTLAMKSIMPGVVENSSLPNATLSKKHGLLAATDSALNIIDPKPHVKHEWTVGNRVRFSCTVYYAQQFDSLRRRCGLEDTFPRSLAHILNWAAEGGKSKANFWKTADNRFIIKTLVNSWNVADLQVLIDLAPAYFRYMDGTASRASVLAKLMGFYTVEMGNIITADREVVNLLVMENLFFEHSITKTFDLKGIQGRKLKALDKTGLARHVDRTLLDSEWIEFQKKMTTLVSAHTKHVLRQAIKADTDFLAKNFIMDYSLLVGINRQQKLLVCGLVDTIGSFSLGKTLEWRVKQGINSGLAAGAKEVTILPPQDYQNRFANVMDSYFLACPDKWTKPPTGINNQSIDLLPSVL